MNNQKDFKPYIPADRITPEITVTSIIMGIILAVVFGAANAYLGLRVGMTVSASIPAAVIAMGVIRVIMRKNSILESNIVQTIGSAGESLAAGAIFTLPALFLWAAEGKMDKPGIVEITIIALLGGLLGAAPQCGFSAAASNFYTGRVITLGTLVAIFLSTSDEMLPILISSRISATAILAILGYKTAVGIAVGFIIDLILKLMRRERRPINIDEICEEDNCHCERGIFFSALHHTLTIGGFILLITFVINALVLFVGSENIAKIMYDKPIISHVIAAILGLIPNCAVSVTLTNLCLEGIITAGTMLSGLFSGAGVGLLILFKVNKSIKENLVITAILVLCGSVFGFVADLLNFSALL